MPNNDDIEHGYSPITPPEEDIEERELSKPEPAPELVPAPSSKAVWVGAPDAPGQANDGLSDLFSTHNIDEADDLRDLTEVDVDRDIIDADEDSGDLSDLTDVTEEDVLGDEETGQFPDATPYQQQMRRTRQLPGTRRVVRYTPPMSLGRSG